jgi:negative regulator of replication initiation
MYDGSGGESDMFGAKIATMITDFNKQNPQYDFPGATWKKLNDMVEKALNEEVSNPNSLVLAEMFASLQNNVNKFLDFLETPAHIYTKTLADICATLPQRTEEL